MLEKTGDLARVADLFLCQEFMTNYSKSKKKGGKWLKGPKEQDCSLLKRRKEIGWPPTYFKK